MSNINGYCPHCNADLDGENIIEIFLSKGYSEEEAEQLARHYSGWNIHGKDNRFSRLIGIYSVESDRVTEWKCPDCSGTWKR